MKGAISAFYSIRKSVFIFLRDKVDKIDPNMEDVNWYREQIAYTERETLNRMEKDLEHIYSDDSWPYEIRMHIVKCRIKESFEYMNQSFMVRFAHLVLRILCIESFVSESEGD